MRRSSLRVQLTAGYAACLLVAGAALLGAGHYVVGRAVGDYQADVSRRFARAIEPQLRRDFPGERPIPPPEMEVEGGSWAALQRRARREAREAQQSRFVRTFLVVYGSAGLVSVVFAWLVAGGVVRRLKRIAEVSRTAAANGPSPRVALAGPSDEIKAVADGLDALLASMEAEAADRRSFVDNASHELRNPLAVMRATLDAALGEARPTREDLRALDAEVTRGERLVSGLLALARSEHADVAHDLVDFGTLVQCVVCDYESAAAARGIGLESVVLGVVLNGDPVLLERMVTNLLDNALKFNRPEGWVRVESRAEGGHAELTVSNSGPVIPASAVERLFEPFQRHAASAAGVEGAGLGLAIVKRVAEAHRGGASAAPGPEGGLCISVRLPLAGPVDQ
jgi:signal transduction histidine kinase